MWIYEEGQDSPNRTRYVLIQLGVAILDAVLIAAFGYVLMHP